jgi:hypothetical protein
MYKVGFLLFYHKLFLLLLLSSFSCGTTGVSVDESLQFWQMVLSGPLMSLVQNVETAALRAVGCDCLATIGTEVLEELPVM